MSRRISKPVLAVAGLALVLSLGSHFARRAEVGPWAPVEPSLQEGRPVIEVPPPNCAMFRRNLTRYAGEVIDPAAVIGAASVVFGHLEIALTRASWQVDPDAAGWREVFDHLRRDAPASATEVLSWYRSELDHASSFVREADLAAVPETPIEVVEVKSSVFEETFPLALYLRGGTLGVITRAATDPAYLGNHCRVCVAPLAVHEGVPGHHLAFSREGAVDPAAPINPVVHEGWALYAEVLMLEHGYWRDYPERELAALRMVAWRALRATIDAELHCGGLDRHAAEELYRSRLGMTADAATIELTRHLLAPGHKASYFVGASRILALRSVVGADRRRFHDELLAHLGPMPEVANRVFNVDLPRFDETAAELWRW